MEAMRQRGLALLLIFTLLLGLPGLMISASAASGKTVDLYVDTVTAMPEESVRINIRLENNPGLASLKLDVAYDDFLTLETVAFDPAFGAYVLAPTPYTDPQTLSFISPLSEVGADGIFATLTFRISADAPDNYTARITVDCDEENVFDGELSPVGVNVHNGAVEIIHGIPGDIDGDRKVNNKDAIMLFRYVAGWDVTVDEKALDVTCDGSVNNKDAITLFRFVAGWDVQIGRGDPCDLGHVETDMRDVSPTCTANGYTGGKQCSVCGKTTVEPARIPALGHAYADGICTRCGDEDESYAPDVPVEGSQGLTFTSNSDGTCYVSGIGSCTDEHVVIPAVSPDGAWVTGIGDSAFSSCFDIVSVTIPDSVTSVGEEAFSQCDGLTTVTLSENLTDIGEKAFYRCTSLRAIFIPRSLLDIGHASFVGCPSLDTITVDEENPVYHSSGNCLIKTASKTLIAGCKNSEIPADGSVTSIEMSAFDGCSSLTEITIPEGVVRIGNYAFAQCGMTELILPESLHDLGVGAFSGCYSLTNLEIPYGVVELRSFLFEACYALTNVTVPDSVSQIHNRAFSGCSNLTDVYYGGSASRWQTVSIGEYNGNLPHATVHFGAVDPVDPNAPLYVATPDTIYRFTLRPINLSYWSDIADAEVAAEGNRSYIRLIADRNSIGDPYVSFAEYRENLQIGRYMAISYRTNSAANGQFYLGSGYGWTGSGDFFDVTWNGDGAWNLTVIDLYSVGLTSIEDDLLNYARIDFFTDAGAEGDYFDIEYIAFFNSAEAAEQYTPAPYQVPMWDVDRKVVTHLSFDQLYLGTGEADYDESTNVFFYPGQSKSWNGVAALPTDAADALTYWGWVGVIGELGSFGYQINDSRAVYDDQWIYETEQAVVDTAIMTGGDTGSRVKIAIPLAGIQGENTVRVLYMDPNGREVCLTEFSLIISDDQDMPVFIPGLAFTSNGNGTCYVSGLGSYASSDVLIPEYSPAGDLVTGIGEDAFRGCSHLTSITIPAAVTYIGRYAFAHCELLTSIELPDGVTNIQEGVFLDCYKLTNVTLPKGVTRIGAYAFHSCRSLAGIVLPEDVKHIGHQAFVRCDSLTSIKLPNGVTTIDTYAFSSCIRLTSIEIPASLQSIGRNAFSNCPGIKDVYYTGTESDWTYIEIGIENDHLISATLHLSEEMPEDTLVNSYVVPMDNWTVTGDKPGITSWTDPSHGSMIDAGLLTQGALLHKGAIGVGEIDLSKYSYAVVYCGCDASNVTRELYNASVNNRIILSRVDTNGIDSPAEEDIIAASTYTLHGWIPEAVIIDLTGIDYKGPVYITYDTLPGTFMLFGKIEFVAEESPKADLWTTYRSAADYREPAEGEELLYTPAPGYEYTDEGFHVISADYSDMAPFGTIQTKEPVSLKNGFYMELRVDEFPYDGGAYQDHWITFHIWDSRKIAPGHLQYGQGWLGLCRIANGAATVVSHISTSSQFLYQNMVSITPEVDENGKKIFTFEVTFDGSEYEIYICGVAVAAYSEYRDTINDLLDSLSPDGRFYMGVSLYSAVYGGQIEATILKCGTFAQNATVPVGTDSKAPEENVVANAPIADRRTR